MSKKKLAQVFHFDLYGKREEKYRFLNENSIKTIQWTELQPNGPNFFLVKKDFDESGMYEKGFKIDELFSNNISGIQTGRDKLFIDDNKQNLIKKIKRLLNETLDQNFINEYNINDSSSYNLLDRINKCKFDENKIIETNYKPFQKYYIYYDNVLIKRSFYSLFKNVVKKDNLSLCLMRSQVNIIDFKTIFITKNVIDLNFYGFQSYSFPLYIYPETNGQQTIEHISFSPPLEGLGEVRTPNLNPEIVKQIAEKLGLQFSNEKTSPTPPKEGLSQPGYVTANPLNYKLIKEMRDNLKDNPTEAEKVMWEYLRNKKTGYKIRRQHIIDNFITDFVCLSKKVIIEIDGKIHLQQKEYDELRTDRLNELEYDVIRFTNEEVFANPELVTLIIKEKLDNKTDLQSDEADISPPLEGSGEVFAPIDILDYIYAVLHSPTYREKYKEFLKIDFPRIPYPKNQETFWQLVKFGGELREIHLLESPTVEKYITQYPEDGTNVVVKPNFVKVSNIDKVTFGKVYINETQYFDNVPEVAWNFYIGGYQPAQKWLKDRKDRKLEFDDILHYQKIIVALTETDKIMKEIDKMEIE